MMRCRIIFPKSFNSTILLAKDKSILLMCEWIMKAEISGGWLSFFNCDFSIMIGSILIYCSESLE